MDQIKFRSQNLVVYLSLIIKEKIIDALFINRDYTPFSTERDQELEKLCTKNEIAFFYHDDALLTCPQEPLKKDGTHYSVFSAFYKKASTIPVEKPAQLNRGTFFSGSIQCDEPKTIMKKILSHANKDIACHGGEKEAVKIIKNLANLKNYKKERDYPYIQTSHLSAHLKFGTLSPRQAYYGIIEHLGRSHLLLRQLYWRDFFTHIAFHVPRVFGHAYHEKYDKIDWKNSKTAFQKWCDGETGFPIVDAGMRELNTTGFMHNRVRMIVASFLVKDLHINWLWGEKYFAQKLVDYDPAVNNGNWQWCASTGCDAQPYFRIFNPWLQQKKYDAECKYIKQWVPELKKYDSKVIHNWFKDTEEDSKGYPRPMVEHTQEAIIAKKMYRKK